MSRLVPSRQNPSIWWGIALFFLGGGFFSIAVGGLLIQGIALGAISAIAAWRAAYAPMRRVQDDSQDD